MNKKRIALILSLLLTLTGVGLFARYKGWWHSTGKIPGGLKVLSYSPQGEEVPISTEGLTVMFNRAMVPLTTLDQGRDKKISLKITPPIEGHFFWLGTHGFIFRPKTPFDPATTYHVEIAGKVASIDGHQLEKPLVWDFSTVKPKIIDFKPKINSGEPAETSLVLPHQAFVALTFNLSMKPEEVEKKLTLLDATKNEPLTIPKEFLWQEEGHKVVIHFKETLPWNTLFKLHLPKGVLAQKGNLGTTEETSFTFKTPDSQAKLTRVFNHSYENGLKEIPLEAGKEIEVPADSSVCYSFSQPIQTESFLKAFHSEISDKQKKELRAHFSEYRNFSFMEGEKLSQKTGANIACVSLFHHYDRRYTFKINPSKIEFLSGATLPAEELTYQARTQNAEPTIHSKLERPILSAKAPQKVFYRGINLKAASFRIFRWKDDLNYSEEILDERLPIEETPDVTGLSGSFAFNHNVRVPVDYTNLLIDPARMPADWTQDVAITTKPNEESLFELDLSGHPLSAGIYLIEAIGVPSSGTLPSDREKLKQLSTYSMIQVTPVGMAIKRETDHVFVWATDIETGQAMANLPVEIRIQKTENHTPEKILTLNALTNSDGVAKVDLPSKAFGSWEDDSWKLEACAKVTQTGNESYSCEKEHRVGNVHTILKPGVPNYFAYVYTDRPIYRPGQKVYFSSFVRQVKEGRYFQSTNTKAKVTVTDAAGEKIFEKDSELEAGGVVRGEFDLKDDENLPRGSYQISLKMGDQSFDHL